MKKKKYWYMTELTICVICGHEKRVRYRVYDKPRPKDRIDRMIIRDDACAIHFI